MPEQLTYQETADMSRSHIGRSCKLHYATAPLKITRASKQYMYDELGNEYLDCISNVSHVGHCHPHVVSAGQKQMAILMSASGFLCEVQVLYAKRIVDTLPERLCVCYFVNSGSEANDLAIRLARAYTKNEDVVVIDNSFHGNVGCTVDCSPRRFKSLPNGKKDYVHVVPTPDTYRGKYRENLDNTLQCYLDEVRKTIQQATAKDRKIAAFMSESLLSQAGVIVPEENYFKYVYKMIREAGGVCVVDEVQVGLGRVADHYWAFQHYDVIPDIVTCGKPLGNGHPTAVVITTKEIAASLPEFANTFGGNPVSCAMGLAVLDVIKNEKLMSSAKFVGRTLMEGFNNIKDCHPMMGDVRGLGMIVGVELVLDKESRKPAKEAAEKLAYRLKEERVLIANDGPEKNVMILTPPLCFNCDNARRVVDTFDKCLTEVEASFNPESGIFSNSVEAPLNQDMDIPLHVISGTEFIEEGKIEMDSDADDPDCKRARYDDVD